MQAGSSRLCLQNKGREGQYSSYTHLQFRGRRPWQPPSTDEDVLNHQRARVPIRSLQVLPVALAL